MSEVSSKDPVSLEDLKRTIGEMQPCPQPESHVSQVLYFEALYEHHDQRAEAWRTAFEWLLSVSQSQERCGTRFQEGLSLIREKLS